MIEERDDSRSLLWVLVGVLAVAVIGLFVWKVVAVGDVEERLEEQRTTMEERRLEALDANTRRLLSLAATPLGLAVREQAMEENFGRMEELLNRIVAEVGIEGIVYATENDSIRVATDRSLVGRPLRAVVPEGAAAGRAEVSRTEAGVYRAVVPITGLNQRIGTVVLTYRPEFVEEAFAAPSEAGPDTVRADTI